MNFAKILVFVLVILAGLSFNGCAKSQYDGPSGSGLPEPHVVPANVAPPMEENDVNHHPKLKILGFDNGMAGYIHGTSGTTQVGDNNGLAWWVTLYQGVDPDGPQNGVGYLESANVVYNTADGQRWTVDALDDYTVRNIVFGGEWGHNPTWFAESPSEFALTNTFKTVAFGALIPTRRSPDKAAHLFASSWPRITLPSNAKHVGVHVRAYLLQGTVMHFGLDRWKTPDETNLVDTPGDPNRTVWQAMISPSFRAADPTEAEPYGTVLIDITMWAPVLVTPNPDPEPTELEIEVDGDQIILK